MTARTSIVCNSTTIAIKCQSTRVSFRGRRESDISGALSGQRSLTLGWFKAEQIVEADRIYGRHD